MSSNTKRGSDPNDFRWFSDEALSKLRIAQQDIQWLLDRGYKSNAAVEFVGNHYQLSVRQRNALQRATASRLQVEKRKGSLLPLDAAVDRCLNIDGFNLIITLEVALSGGPLILGGDGVLRDLAGLRGTYHPIPQTDTALELIGKALKELSVGQANFYLDKPVSNSGRLKKKILEHATQWDIPVQAELVPNTDAVITGMERVVTGDSVILDHCASWFNLSGKIVGNYVRDAWIIRLDC